MTLCRSKKFIVASLLLFGLGLFTIPVTSFAQPAPPATEEAPSAVGTAAGVALDIATMNLPGAASKVFSYLNSDPNSPTLAQEILYKIVVAITGLWLTLGGLLLDLGINYFLIGFAKTFGDTGVGVAVDTTWATVRDFVNLTFIFGLVYIGFKLILNNNDSDTKRWLASLIMAALLINFSLFITKTAIEVSNQFAIKIIESGFEDVKRGPDNNIESVDVSGSLMQRLGISGLLGSGDLKGKASADNGWGYIFGTGILFLIAGFVFAAGGVLLIIRFAILNFYMVLSPVLFLGFILPPLAGSINKYWEKFLAQAFFAPIYILMLYFSFRILDGMQTSGRFSPNGESWIATVGVSDGTSQTISVAAASTLPFFILTCFFLIGSLMIAKKMGAEGAAKAVSAGQKLSKATGRKLGRGAGAGTVGLAASLGRNTVGRAAYAATQSENFRDRAGRSSIGKAMLKTAEYGSKASYDARRVAGVGKELGIGEGKAGGFKKRIDDANKKHKEFADKSLGTVDIDTPEGKEKVAQKEIDLKRRKEAEKAQTEKAVDARKSVKELSEKSPEELKIYVESKELEAKAKQQELGSIDEPGSKYASMTAEQKETARGKLQEELQTSEAKKREALAAIEISKKKSPMKQELSDLGEEEARANASGDTVAYKKAREARLTKQAQLNEIDSEMEDEIQTLEKQVGEISDLLKNEDKMNQIAQAEVKYSRQIDYMKQMQSGAETWKVPGAVGAGYGAGVAGASVFTAAGVLAAPAAAAASARGAEFEYALKEMQKEYGKDGTKKMKRDKRIKDLRDRKAADKDIEGEVGGNDTKPAESNDETK